MNNDSQRLCNEKESNVEKRAVFEQISHPKEAQTQALEVKAKVHETNAVEKKRKIHTEIENANTSSKVLKNLDFTKKRMF